MTTRPTDRPTDRPTGETLIRLRAQGLCLRCRYREPPLDLDGIRKLLCDACEAAIAKQAAADRARRRRDTAEQLVIDGCDRD